MSEYMTEQRRELLSFFAANPDKSFTAKELAEYLGKINISVSAIYRNLSRLEEDGHISRTVRQGSRESYYQSLISDVCRDCIHLSCTKCGNTFHMDHKLSDALRSTLSENDGFEINRAKTVLYGICGKCGGGKNEEHS